MVTWRETDKSTVTHIEDFAEGIVYTNITMPDLTFYNYKGTLKPVGDAVAGTEKPLQEENKEIAIKFLDLAFNKNDVEAAAELTTERYIQHNPFVADGRKGFIEGIKGFHKNFPNIS